MFYFCLAFTVVWLFLFLYILSLDRQTRNLQKRINAHSENT